MFWKLFKFELNSAYRSFALFYVILLISAVFIGFSTSLPQSNISLFIQLFIGMSAFLYGAMLFAINILTMVFVVRGYDQSMYRQSAYLTHTLPVSSKQLMLVKILSAVFWIFATVLVELISGGVIVLAAGHFEAIFQFFQIVARLWTEIPHKGEFFTVLFEGLVTLFESISLLYFVVNFVHSSYVQRGRIAIAIGLFVVVEILESLFLSWFNGYVLVSVLDLSGVAVNLSVALFYLIMLAIWYFGSVYLLKNKLEVE